MNPLEIDTCKLVFFYSFKKVERNLNSYFGCFFMHFTVFCDVADVEGVSLLLTAVSKDRLRSILVELIGYLRLINDLRLVLALLVLVAVDSAKSDLGLSQNDLVALKRRANFFYGLLLARLTPFLLGFRAVCWTAESIQV